MNGELVGHWTVVRGRHEFRYAATWLESSAARPLSHSMPLQDAAVPYRDVLVESFFDNLLPDSSEIRRRIQARFATRTTSAFELLAMIGRDCVGAIQLLPPDERPRGIHRISGTPLTNHGVAAALRAAVATPALGQRDADDFRISIAGAQEKTALLLHNGQWHHPRGSTPTTHIFKLPLGHVGNMQLDMSTSVENEWLCARIVRAYGLDIADCEMKRFEDQHVLIVTRFDRKRSQNGNWLVRLPVEDFCQATATPSGHKYQSDGGPGIRDIMALLLGSSNAKADRRTFFKAQILFWMLCATEGHAKNFSIFIGLGGSFTLTPLYDVLSAYPVIGTGAGKIAPQKVKMAMAVTGTSKPHYLWKTILRRHWLATAAACSFGSEAGGVIDELVARTPEVVDQIRKSLPKNFPVGVATPILEGLESAAKQLAAEEPSKR